MAVVTCAAIGLTAYADNRPATVKDCLEAATAEAAIEACTTIILATEDLPLFTNEERAVLYRTRGQAYGRTGDIGRGIIDLEEAVGLDATTANYVALAKLEAARHNLDKALDQLDRALAEANSDVERIEALRGRAIMLVEKRDYTQAVDALARAIAIDDRIADLFYLRGYAEELRGDPRLAIISYRAALHIEPQHTRSLAALSRLGVQP
jgi:tetratricopeptide (TPR) repeat protein